MDEEDNILEEENEPTPEEEEEEQPPTSDEDDDETSPGDESEEDDPRRAQSIEDSTRSYIGWNLDHNSPIANQFNTFEAGMVDPYKAAGSALSSGIETIYRGTSSSQNFEGRERAISAFSDSISSRYGTTVRLSGTGIYNRTIGKTGSTIGSNQERSEISVYKPPRGLVTRPIDRDWNTFQESNKKLHMREAVYQIQERSYVGGLIERAKDTSVKTEVMTQGFKPLAVFDDAGQLDLVSSRRATKSSAKVLGGNEVSLQALEQSNVQTNRVTFDTEGRQVTPQFHAKLSYYYEEDEETKAPLVQAATIGSQNRTRSLQNRDSLEEVLFLSMDMVKDKHFKQKQQMQSILQEIARATDAMFQLGGGVERTAAESRRVVEAAFNARGPAEYVALNKDIHTRRLSELQRADRARKQKQVILSTQYLETTLFSSRQRDKSNKAKQDDAEFTTYKQDFFKTLESLSEKGRLTLVLSATGMGGQEGLYALFDRLNDDQQIFDLFGEDQSENTKQRIQRIIEKSVSVVPTRLKHSKGMAVLNEDASAVEVLEVSSANLSYNSFANNIEAGILLKGNMLHNLGIIGEDELSYFRAGLMNKMSNDGLYVERKGDSEYVRRAKDMLSAMGGVETRDYEARAPFKFSTRYSSKGKAVGLDIVLKNQFSFSVTIGSSLEPRYNRKTGQQDLTRVPILYLNKGNRVIVGMNYVNKSTRNIAVQSTAYDTYQQETTVLAPGESVGADALQVLGGIVHTMSQGMEYEENTRLMYHGLKKLLEQGDAATLKAIQRATNASTGGQADLLQQLKEIVETKNVERVRERSRLIAGLIQQNAVAQSFYKGEMKAAKSQLFKQLTEIYPQLHELSYSHSQLFWKRPLYGLTPEVEDLHYRGVDDDRSLIMPGFLLSDLPIEHNEIVRGNEGMTLVRGASETARASTLAHDEMLGGLIKVKGGALMPYSIEMFNGMPGLSMISYQDYARRVKLMGIDPASDYGQSLIESIFALERRRIEEEEEDDWETRKTEAVMLYTPYDKTEQNIQRFKNLKSIRNFLPAHASIASFLSQLGMGSESISRLWRQKIKKAQAEGTDLETQFIVGGSLASAMPSAQFSELQRMAEEATDTQELMRKIKDRAIDTNEPLQGFLNSPRRVMVSYGISEMSDYSYMNTAAANRLKRYLKVYTAQAAISSAEMNMTPTEFNAKLSETVKVGTMFVAKDVLITQDKPNLGGVYDTVVDKVNSALADQGFTNTYATASAEEIRQTVKYMRDEYRAGRRKDFSFIEGFYISKNAIRLKKGVYATEDASEGFLKRIGGLAEGDTAFYIDGMQQYKSVGRRSRVEPFKIKAPAFSGRELDSISFLFRAPVSSVQDQRTGMVTYNFEMINLSEIKTGQRTAMAKGPFVGRADEYFKTLADIYALEVGETNLALEVDTDTVFAVIAAGQMKGFVFEAGLGFLREGEESGTWKMINDPDRQQAGYRIAEALSLMMLGEKGAGSTVASALEQAYERGEFENRRQTKALLQQITSGRYAPPKLPRKDTKNKKLEQDFAPTIALYEGLMSLVSESARAQSDIGVEQALVNTIVEALQEGLSGDKAREELADKAKNLLEKTRDNYAIEVESKYTYDETRARSGSVMAFFLNAARDLLSDINVNKRMAAGGLTELAYKTQGFVERAKKEQGVQQEIMQEFRSQVEKSVEELKNSNKYTRLIKDWDGLIDTTQAEILRLIQTARSAQDILEQINQNRLSTLFNVDLSDLAQSLIDKYGGLSARELLLTSNEQYREESLLLQEGMKRQTFALNIDMPSIDRIKELKEKSDRTSSEDKELDLLEKELDLTIYQMRTIGQFDLKMNLPMEMAFNKITVPTGMEDTTSLEGHYANALTQRQLDLYTYNASDREKATTLQQTLVILGGMLQEGLGSSLTGNDVSRLYTIRSISAVLLGYTDFSEEDEQDFWLDDKVLEERRRRNKLKQSLRQETEAHHFSIAFSQGYGFFTARSRANIFPSKVHARTKDISPAQELFYSFIEGDRQQYDKSLEQMRWVRQVSSDKTNLTMQERASAITKDYLQRIKNNETIVGGQVDTLLQGITERSLEQLGLLQKTNLSLFGNAKKKNKVTKRDAFVDDWANNLSQPRRETAISMLQTAGITIADDAEAQDISDAIKNNRAKLRQTMSPQARLEFASLGFDALGIVMQNDQHLLDEDSLEQLSMDQKRTAFIQLLVREKVKKAVDTSKDFSAAITSVINKTRQQKTLEQRAISYIVDAPETQERLLESIIRNEVSTKLKRAEDIDPGKEYIEGRQKLRKYARDYLSTGQGTNTERERAQALINSVNKTYRVSIPVLELNTLPNKRGNYDVKFSAEKQTEGWVLGLDVLERMSLVFPGHTHEALRAQYNLIDALQTAEESGLFKELARAATSTGDIELSQQQLEAYTDLAKYAMQSKEATLDLTRNQETFRKTMADRLSMTGASYIGMNSFLVRSAEVALGTRAETLVKTNSGSGIRPLIAQMSLSLKEHFSEEHQRQKRNLEQQLMQLGAQLQDPNLTPSRRQTLRQKSLEIHEHLSRVRTELRVDFDRIKETQKGRRAKGFAETAAKLIREISTVTGSTEGQNVTWQSLLELARTDNTYRVANAQQASQNQVAAGQASQTKTSPATTRVDTGRYAKTSEIISSISQLIGGEDLKPQDVQRLEKMLFKSMVLVARQGAPSGVFHTYSQGHQMIDMETVAERANTIGSLLAPEIGASNTGMLISALGNQFTQLGDYDGDSFQAAFTKMSSAAREVSESMQELRKAEMELNEIEEQPYSDDVVTNAVSGGLNTAKERFERAAEDIAVKLQSLNELKMQLDNRGAEQLRGYTSDFIGLPVQFLEGDESRVGAIKDEELSSLVKQSRDTLANLYGNYDKIKGELNKALSRTTEVTFNRRGVNIKSDDDGLSQEQANGYKELVRSVTKDYLKYATDQEKGEFLNLDMEEKSKRLIEFSSIMSQRMATLSGLGKTTNKITGSLLNDAALANLQAIVGSTGTGLLGKTYNTIVPLLGLAVSDMAAIRTMRENAEGTDQLSEVFEQALLLQREKMRRQSVNISATDREKYQQQVDVIDALTARQQQKDNVPYELVSEEMRSRLNTNFGLLLNIQQFLRDAALKPKKGGSVALSAAEFKYTLEDNRGDLKEITGLSNILEQVDDSERSKVMAEFIGSQAGAVLAQDYGFTFDDSGKVQAQRQMDKNEVRAFAALEMVNEYLSGKYSASDMMEDSAFAGLLQRRKEHLQEQRKGVVSDEMVVETTLADTLARFQSEFRYNAVLEGSDYGAMLDKFDARLQEGYSEEGLKTREAAYRNIVTEAYNRQYDNTPLSNEVLQDIDRRTQEWRRKEDNLAAVIETARTDAEQQRQAGQSLSDGQAVFKAVLEYQSQLQAQEFVGTETKPGLFSALRSLNTVISGLQSDNYASPGTAQEFAIAQQAILYNVARGKLEGTTLNESIFRLAEEVRRTGNSAEAVGAFLSVGGATSLPGLMEFVEQHATNLAGDDTSKKDSLIKDTLVTLGEILTTQVDQDGKQVSVAEIIAEKSVVSASSAKIQQEINELNMREANLRQNMSQVGEEGDNVEVEQSLDILTNMRKHLEEQLKGVQSNKAAAEDVLKNEVDVVGQFLQEIDSKIDQDIAESVRTYAAKQQSKQIQDIQKRSARQSTKTSLVSLLAIPTALSLMQDDGSITERLADISRNIIESALTLSTYEGSLIRRLLIGEDSGATLMQQIQSLQDRAKVPPYPSAPTKSPPPPTPTTQTSPTRTATLALPEAALSVINPPQTTADQLPQRPVNIDTKPKSGALVHVPKQQPGALTVFEKPSSSFSEASGAQRAKVERSYLSQEAEEASNASARANYLLRVARSKEFMLQSQGRISGMAQALAFEAINTAGSVISSEIAQNTRLLRDDSMLARGAVEMTGAVVGMALASVITKRPIPATDFSYDAAFNATMATLENIRDGVLAASSRAASSLVNGADVDVTDGYTGESLDAVVAEGDFTSPDDNTSITALERVMMTEGMLEGEEDMEVEE